jgi:CRISPR-associated exonuclease Cas4
MTEEDDYLPISALHHLLFCERSLSLVHVLGVWRENGHTTEGRIVHESVDTGRSSARSGHLTLRSPYVRSDELRLRGIADVVEAERTDRGWSLVPVEYKKGKRRVREDDDVQLAAQAMALEEMTGVSIPLGAIFYAGSARRREVRIDAALRARTREAARRLHLIVDGGLVPPAIPAPKCTGCSLIDACQPTVSPGRDALTDALAAALADEE